MSKVIAFLVGLGLLGGGTFAVTYQVTTEKIKEDNYREDIKNIILHNPELLKIESVEIMDGDEYEQWVKDGQEYRDLEGAKFGFRYGAKKSVVKNKLKFYESKEDIPTK